MYVGGPLYKIVYATLLKMNKTNDTIAQINRLIVLQAAFYLSVIPKNVCTAFEDTNSCMLSYTSESKSYEDCNYKASVADNITP